MFFNQRIFIIVITSFIFLIYLKLPLPIIMYKTDKLKNKCSSCILCLSCKK